MEKNTEEVLAEVMKTVLKVNSIERNDSMENIPYWDSLKHLQLIAAIEKKFGIEFSFEDSIKMTTVSSILNLVQKYIKKDSATDILITNDMLRPHQLINKPSLLDYNNVYGLFKAQGLKTPEKDFCFFPGSDQKCTYREFQEIFLVIAAELQARNLPQGARINLILANSKEFVILYFAALSIGATVVPINPDLSSSEMEYIIRQSQAKAVYYDLSLEQKMIEIKKNLNSKCLFGAAQEIINTKGHNKEGRKAILPPVKLTDEAVIIYTSGTTGNPKGAVLTHLNLLSDAKAVSEWFYFTPETRTLCLLPLHHNNGQVITLLTPLYAGGSTVIVQGKASLHSFWWLVKKYNINWTSVMPSILSILLSLPRERDDDTMSGIICGGQVLIPEVQQKFEERFKVPIFEGYGLTETTSFACFNNYPQEKRKKGSVGKALAINSITIFDENDQQVGPDQEGEICIRGLNVINEYFNLEEKNKETFRNGWFHSGDFGFQDEEGYIYFKARKDFLIIKGGENIYPSELENVLFQHSKVAECAVIGIPSKLLGEEICAFVKLKEKTAITAEELKKFFIGKIGEFKHPKEIIIVNELDDMPDIPKGPTNKVLYRELKEYYLQKIQKRDSGLNL